MSNLTLSIQPFQLMLDTNNVFINNEKIINLIGGDRILLTGNNGSGKSHLLQIIKGIIPQLITPYFLTDGCILYQQKQITDLTLAEARTIIYLGSNPRTGFVFDQVLSDLKLSYYGLTHPHHVFIKSVTAIAEQLQMQHLLNSKISNLSQGQQQLIHIIKILLQQPLILLLDEITNCLDDNNSKLVIDCIHKYLPNSIIITVDHNPQHITQFINKQLVIKNGQLLSDNNNTLTPVNNNYQFEQSPHYSQQQHKTENILELKQVNFSWNQHHHIFKELNLKINSGQVINIYGNNGSGKSILLQLITKQILPKSGSILISGQLLQKLKKSKIYKKISILFTHSSLHFFELTVEKEIINISKSTKQILTDINLLDKKELHFNALSQGEQKRLALTIVLYSDTDILLLDDPFLGQDVNNREKLEKMITDINKTTNKTIIIISSKLSMLSKNSDITYKIENYDLIPKH